jgi:hypothetical protein
MIKNFDEVKTQLAELSDVVNKFKSEQVQLKIVDLIFKNAEFESDGDEGVEPQEVPTRSSPRKKRGGPRKRKVSATSAGAAGTTPKKAKAKGTGPAATLQLLLDRGFFDKKKTIGDVIEHCQSKLARSIPMNQMSTPLARFVRDEKLDRSKNAEGQFEYIKK